MTKSMIAAALVLAVTAVSAAPTSQPTVPKPEGIHTEGIPPIPKSLAETIRPYGQARAAMLQSWSPAGRELLISTRFGDTYQLHSVRTPMGARRQLTFYSDPVNSATYPPVGDASYFVFSKDHDGNEQFQKYRYDLATGRETLLTDGKSRNTGGTWSHDGRSYAYGSTRRTGKDVDFYLLDPRDPKSDRLVCKNEGGGWEITDFSPNSKTLLATEYLSATDQRLYLVDLATGEKTLVAPAKDEPKTVLAGGQFSADGKSVFLATDRGSEFQRLARLDLATKQFTVLTDSIPWDVEDFRVSWDGKRVAVVINEEGFSTLHVLDTATDQLKKIEGLPRGVITSPQWHPNNREIAFTAGSAQTTADAYSVDVNSGKVERWTESETGGIPNSQFVQPSLVKYKTFDDREIPAFVYRADPKKFPGKRPAIVLVHGGPEGQARPTFMGSYNYYLNELGVTLIEPNVRGSSGYGKTYLDLDNSTHREDSYKDVGALLDWIAAQPDLDKDRVLVTGGSYGGNVTYAVAFMYPDKIRCAISIVGSSNLVTFLENTSPYRRDLRRVEYGDERIPEVRAYLQRIAPINHLDRLTKPLLVEQGGNDPRVPASEAEQIIQAMKAKDQPAWYLLAKDEGHGFAKQSNREYEQAVRAEFVKRYLLD